MWADMPITTKPIRSLLQIKIRTGFEKTTLRISHGHLDRPHSGFARPLVRQTTIEIIGVNDFILFFLFVFHFKGRKV